MYVKLTRIKTKQKNIIAKTNYFFGVELARTLNFLLDKIHVGMVILCKTIYKW
jgi:hypothetical protein